MGKRGSRKRKNRPRKRSRVRVFGSKKHEEQNAILQRAAKDAVNDYENDRELVWDDAEEPLDYY
jgi:hypothetical protein